MLRRTAQLVAVYHAGLAINYGIAAALGDEKDKPNFTDISKRDWLRYRIAGYSVPLSPMVETLKLPFRIIASGLASRHAKFGEEKNPLKAAADPVVDYILQSAHPSIQTAAEIPTGRETGTGKVLPFGSPTGKPGSAQYIRESKERIGWGEYAANKALPIPASATVHEFYDMLRDEGLSNADSITWAKYLMGAPLHLLGYERVKVRDQKPKH